VTFEEWERTVPESITGDALWRVKVYRLALYAANIGWADITALAKDRRAVSLSDQLCRSLGSISANIAEGFSRSSNRDRARCYEYALGSVRECRDWYFKARFILNESIIAHRLELITEIIRLLLVMLSNQRKPNLKEESEPYNSDDAETPLNDYSFLITHYALLNTPYSITHLRFYHGNTT